MNNFDPKHLNQMAKGANINVNELKNAVEQGKTEDFINKKLSPEAAQKLKAVLNDKNTMDKMLQTKEAKELLNKLMNK